MNTGVIPDWEEMFTHIYKSLADIQRLRAQIQAEAFEFSDAMDDNKKPHALIHKTFDLMEKTSSNFKLQIDIVRGLTPAVAYSLEKLHEEYEQERTRLTKIVRKEFPANAGKPARNMINKINKLDDEMNISLSIENELNERISTVSNTLAETLHFTDNLDE